MKSDLSTLSPMNILSKYADDINLIVPQYCDVVLPTEFDNIQHWAMCNKMTINLSKTKEIVFRRPCPLLVLTHCSHQKDNRLPVKKQALPIRFTTM